MNYADRLNQQLADIDRKYELRRTNERAYTVGAILRQSGVIAGPCEDPEISTLEAFYPVAGTEYIQQTGDHDRTEYYDFYRKLKSILPGPEVPVMKINSGIRTAQGKLGPLTTISMYDGEPRAAYTRSRGESVPAGRHNTETGVTHHYLTWLAPTVTILNDIREGGYILNEDVKPGTVLYSKSNVDGEIGKEAPQHGEVYFTHDESFNYLENADIYVGWEAVTDELLDPVGADMSHQLDINRPRRLYNAARAFASLGFQHDVLNVWSPRLAEAFQQTEAEYARS